MAKKTVEELAQGLVNILREEGGVAWRDKLIYRLQDSEQVVRNEAFYALTYARSEGLIEHVHNEQWYPATMRIPGETRSKPEDPIEVEAKVEEESEPTPFQLGVAKLVAERQAEQEALRSTFAAAERYLAFRGEPFSTLELMRALQGALGVDRYLASNAAVHLVDAGFATKSYTDGMLTPVGYINPEDKGLLSDSNFPDRESIARHNEIRIDGTDYTASLISNMAFSGDSSRGFRLESAYLGFAEPFFDEIFVFTEEELNDELIREYFEDYRLGKLTYTDHGWRR